MVVSNVDADYVLDKQRVQIQPSPPLLIIQQSIQKIPIA